ncbi:hypothetical protein [Rudaea sp.]|uniref:hypothetical protein n=1 Tax=Rudaea sp. TaxID=2136325 RepID=UPI003784908B
MGVNLAHGNTYNHHMSAKLATTNRYLQDAEMRRKLIFKSVASSSAIEGIRAPFKQLAGTKKAAPSARPIKR